MALAIGAYGHLVKPVGGNEPRIIVASSLRRRELELARRRHVDDLEAIRAAHPDSSDV